MEHQKSFSCIEFTIQCHHLDRDYFLFDSTSDPSIYFRFRSTLDHSLKLSPGVPSLHPLHSRAHLPIPSFRSFSTFSPLFFRSLPSTPGPQNLPRRVSRSSSLHRRPSLPVSLRLWRGWPLFALCIAASVLTALRRFQPRRAQRRFGGRFGGNFRTRRRGSGGIDEKGG